MTYDVNVSVVILLRPALWIRITLMRIRMQIQIRLITLMRIRMRIRTDFHFMQIRVQMRIRLSTLMQIRIQIQILASH